VRGNYVRYKPNPFNSIVSWLLELSSLIGLRAILISEDLLEEFSASFLERLLPASPVVRFAVKQESGRLQSRKIAEDSRRLPDS